MSRYGTAAGDLPVYGAPAAALSPFSTADQNAALDAASAEADAEFARVFELPLTAWGVAVTQRVCWIAAFELLRTRGFDSPDDGNSYKTRAAEARAWFKRVGDGTLAPPDIADATTDVLEGGVVCVTNPRRRWIR